MQVHLAFAWFHRFFRLKSFVALSPIFFFPFFTKQSFHTWMHLLLFLFKNNIFVRRLHYFWRFYIEILNIFIIFSSGKLLLFKCKFLLSFSYVWSEYILHFAFAIGCSWEIKFIYIIRLLFDFNFFLYFLNCFILRFF